MLTFAADDFSGLVLHPSIFSIIHSRSASIINDALSNFWYWLNSNILVSSEGVINLLNIIKKINKDYNKKACERYHNLSKEQKKESYKKNMVMTATKIFQKMKKINWFSIENYIIEWEKTLYYNYKKIFWFRKFFFFIRESREKWVYVWKVI